MRRIASLALAAAVLMTAPAIAPAQSRLPPAFFTGDIWTVHQVRNLCTLHANFNSGYALYITHVPADDRVAISIYSDNARSVVDSRPYQLTVIFVDRDPDRRTRNYEPATFNGIANAEGDRGYFGHLPGSGFLDDMTRFQIFGVAEGDDLVGSFSLDGAPEAVAQLRRCNAQLAGGAPTDTAPRRTK
jgi:hypothetical protein